MDRFITAACLRFALMVALGCGSTHVSAGVTQDIWFVPKYDQDFMGLFATGAPWNQAAGHIKVIELSNAALSKAPEQDLQKVFAGLRERHIALALDMLPLKGSSSTCGYHVEGYSNPGQTLSFAQHVKALGGLPTYYDMDEPLYYGHYYQGVNACQSDLSTIAQDIAEKVKQVRAMFPDVKIGESEPLIAVVNQDGITGLEKWLEAYRRAVGEPLGFMRLDMDWQGPWRQRVPAIAQLLRREGVALQVIYNGSGQDKSDDEWVNHAAQHAKDFEGVVKPDSVAIQSWTPRPTHVLPDTDPRTLTGLVNQYAGLR
jgi:hypothetical protein